MLKKINIKITTITLLLFFITTVILSLSFPPSEDSEAVKNLKNQFKKSKMWQDENGVFWDDLFYEVNKVHFDDFNSIDDLNLSAYPEEVQDKIIALEAFSKNYEHFDRFTANYKNTILSWFSREIDLEINYYIEKRTNKFDYYLMPFASILPYIIIVSFLLLSFRLFNKNKS